MGDPLHDTVQEFIDDLAPVLAELADEARMQSSRADADVALEASNIAGAFIDVDGLHTDEEVWAYVGTFAPHFDTLLQFARPAQVRKAGIFDDRREWLAKPSVLFEILVAKDHRAGTRHSWRYYERAMAIAHAVCALDRHPAHVELEAVDRFRTMLLGRMENWAVPRPGHDAGPGSAPARPDASSPATVVEALRRPLDELLAELDALVGLGPVKAEVRLVANLIQVQNLRRSRNLAVAESSRHLVFTGNPGTGKTTVARLLAQIYRTLGVVAKGHLVESDRSQLVAGYVGQTAIQVRKVVESALGGVLLVDEAYALARGDERDFGQEAIDTLVKLIEDHRDDVVVVAAGYPDEMADFIDSNPGLRSRFPKTIAFPDYSDDELVAIFLSMAAKSAYACAPGLEERLRAWFAAQPRDKGFGNARLARNLFEAVIARQASRIVGITSPSDEQLMALTTDDVGPIEATA
ncbi:MAG TPA: AAA family ATPase [Acidimicrobiales bacterium]|nr:AAA family ATPase [Acidimicrobiales bacterium]